MYKGVISRRALWRGQEEFDDVGPEGGEASENVQRVLDEGLNSRLSQVEPNGPAAQVQRSHDLAAYNHRVDGPQAIFFDPTQAIGQNLPNSCVAEGICKNPRLLGKPIIVKH